MKADGSKISESTDVTEDYHTQTAVVINTEEEPYFQDVDRDANFDVMLK